MPLHAEPERLEALQKQERIEGAESRAKVAQAFDSGLHDEGKIAESFVEPNAVIAFARLEKLWKRAPVPREAAAIHNHASDRRAVPTDELGGGVQNDIRPVLNGPAQIGGSKRIINDQRNARLV